MDIDLTCKYGGLELRSPIIVGACNISSHEPSCIGLVTAGAGAIVLQPIFEEQVSCWNDKQGFEQVSYAVSEHMIESEMESDRDAHKCECNCADDYLESIHRLSSHLPIPVLASMNGRLGGNWIDFAKEVQFAGAAGVELHLHQNHCHWEPQKIEDSILKTAKEISKAIQIPLFLKLDHSFTNISHFAKRLSAVADGIVLYGQSPSVDIDLKKLRLDTVWGTSKIDSITDSLLSIIQTREFCPEISIAANGGINSSEELLKAMIAGADVVMVASALYQKGASAIGTILEGMIRFMEVHHLTSIEELRNLLPTTLDATAERNGYVHAISNQWGKCQTETTPWGVRVPR